ncbi:hypothetical protein QJS04_geneDACA013366 [Acorus gramineus]|uniref:Uncharacterized protein n=1 Tax=Acorus gramineus TaxID=55184 RepID=A0AAV9AAM0_ACOGR|nr:hypothetical protein QJS04_geneDACA013366 [Acorus gramineus]
MGLVTTTHIAASTSSVSTLDAASDIKATLSFTLPHTSSYDNCSITSGLLWSPPILASDN